MKKVLALFMSCSLLIMGCRHDDVLENDPNQSHEENGLKGKNFVLTQTELEAKYAGNKSLNNILQKEFKTEGELIKTNSDGENGNGVYIDLDHVQVFESAEMHTITYYVEIGEQEQTNEPQEVYNLMYFSRDYENYHVILFKYDFNQISFQQFIKQPELATSVLGFIPLNDIENIYENIDYSISHGLMNTSAVQTTSTSPTVTLKFSDCVIVTVIPPQPCQVCTQYKGEVRNGRVCTNDNPDTMPVEGSVTYDFTGCGSTGGGGTGGNPGSGGGGGSVSNPGGGWAPGGGTTPTTPIWSNPIKSHHNLFDLVKIRVGINTGNTNTNLEVLKGIIEHNLPTVQDLYSKANATREYGYVYTKQLKNGKYVPLANQVPLPLNNGSNWALNVDDYIKIAINTGVLHVHTNKNTIIHDASNRETKANPMFSHSDLQTIFRIGKVNSMSNKKELYDLFVGLITSNNLYVVMFPSGTTKIDFQTVSNGTPFSYYINVNEFWTKVGDELGDKYKKIATLTIPPSPEQEAAMYEKALLEVLKDNNIPLNLYRLPANNGLFNGTWKLLGLDANGNVTENQGH